MRLEQGPAIRWGRHAVPRTAATAALLAAFALGLAGVPPALAVSNTLSAGSVAPGSGTTETPFVFQVSYHSPRGAPATRVWAQVAGRDVELALVAGTADDGVFRAVSVLPAGSWPVVFQATASQGRSPTLAGPTVTVSPVPAPTPPPTPVPPPPTPAPPPPTAAAIPPPAVAPPSAPTPSAPPSSATSSPGASGSQSAAPAVPSPSADAEAGVPGGKVVPGRLPGDAGGAPVAVAPWLLLLALLVFGGAGFLALARGRRRARSTEIAPLPGAAPTPATPTASPPKRRRLAEWELSALDDEPIGTVEYFGPRP